MPEIAYINGSFMPLDQASVPLEDRGLQFGDSLYEVVRVYGGKPFRLAHHLRRMRQGARVIGLPEACLSQLESICGEVLERSQVHDGLIYVQTTRGVAPRSHVLQDASVAPTVIVYARSAARRTTAQPVKAITHEDLRWPWCFIKATTLLPNVIMQTRALEQGAHDCILYRDGMVTEGTRTNVFVVVNGVLRTAPLSQYILAGVTRQAVLELASQLAVPVEPWPVSLKELEQADEAFFTGTMGEITPITTIDARTVGRGEVGPVVRSLLAAFDRLIAAECSG